MRLPRPADLTQNWRLKLTALALALLLWALVSSEQPTTQWIRVPVEAVVSDPDYVLTGGPDPATVSVRFSGPGRELWELALERTVLVLPVARVGDARTFALDPQMVRIPGGLPGIRVHDVRPAVVRLGVQRVVSRDVPVRARIGQRSLSAYVVGDTVRVSPSYVRVTGPADQVERIEALVTRAFEIVPDGDTAFSRSVEIDTAGLGGVSLFPGEVRVSGGLDRRVERVIRGVSVSVPAGLAATPAEVEVHVQGPERGVRLLPLAGLAARVPADSLPAEVPVEGVEAPVEVDGLPPGMTARTVPLRVRVAPIAVAPPPPGTRTAPPARPSTGRPRR